MVLDRRDVTGEPSVGIRRRTDALRPVFVVGPHVVYPGDDLEGMPARLVEDFTFGIGIKHDRIERTVRNPLNVLVGHACIQAQWEKLPAIDYCAVLSVDPDAPPAIAVAVTVGHGVGIRHRRKDIFPENYVIDKRLAPIHRRVLGLYAHLAHAGLHRL